MNADKAPFILRRTRAWIVWKTCERNGTPTKLPFRCNGEAAKSNDPQTWDTFDAAVKCYQQGGYDGVGFVFSDADEFCGIDLDGCRNPETREFAPWAREIIERFDSYTEVSPSLTGAKIFCMGKNPFGSGKKFKVEGAPKMCEKEPAIEVYDCLRYFAVTGMRLGKVSGDPEPRQEALDWLAAKYAPEPAHPVQTEWYSEAAVLDRARKYLAKMPAAVSGQDGHGRTFNAACILTLGFGLPANEALGLLREYNQVCQPPWTDKELLHKISDSLKQPGERNYLRNQQPQRWDRVNVPSYKEPEPTPEAQIITLEAATRKYLETIKGGKTTLLELGLPSVDAAIGGGAEPGEMVILAARPSHGKSAVALQAVHYATALGIPVAFVSEEMSSLALGKRTVQFASNVPQEDWFKQEANVQRQVDEHFKGRAPCIVIESCRSAQRAAEEIRKAVETQGVKIAVVDYAQLLTGTGKTRYEQITNTSIVLRQLASGSKIVVVVLCQMSRAIESRPTFTPTISDLKDTGQLEQDADIVLFLCWPHRLDHKVDPTKYQFYIEKNRNRGITESLVECVFKPSRQMFVHQAPAAEDQREF